MSWLLKRKKESGQCKMFIIKIVEVFPTMGVCHGHWPLTSSVRCCPFLWMKSSHNTTFETWLYYTYILFWKKLELHFIIKKLFISSPNQHIILYMKVSYDYFSIQNWNKLLFQKPWSSWVLHSIYHTKLGGYITFAFYISAQFSDLQIVAREFMWY